MISFSEILVVLIIVIVIFGAGKFPNIMKNIADGINVFKKTINEKEKKKISPEKKANKKTKTK